jgi:hypothetical protein
MKTIMARVVHKCPICSSPVTLKEGRFGKFFGCTRYPKCTGNIPYIPPCDHHRSELVTYHIRDSDPVDPHIINTYFKLVCGDCGKILEDNIPYNPCLICNNSWGRFESMRDALVLTKGSQTYGIIGTASSLKIGDRFIKVGDIVHVPKSESHNEVTAVVILSENTIGVMGIADIPMSELKGVTLVTPGQSLKEGDKVYGGYFEVKKLRS